MLIDHNMFGFGIIFHDVLDVLGKSTSVLPFYDGEFILIFSVFLFEKFFEY